MVLASAALRDQHQPPDRIAPEYMRTKPIGPETADLWGKKNTVGNFKLAVKYHSVYVVVPTVGLTLPSDLE